MTTRIGFRPEIAALARPCDLTENVRLLDARLRGTEAAQLTAEEAAALASLLQTVSRLATPTGASAD